MSDKTGGPAYPQINHWDDNRMRMGDSGMSLRDYFAAKALPAYFSDGNGHGNFYDAANWSYEMADAMLKARQA